MDRMLSVISQDFGVDFIADEYGGAAYYAQRRDLWHFLKASARYTPNESTHRYQIAQNHVPRFALAEAMHQLNQFNASMRPPEHDGRRLCLGGGSGDVIGLNSAGVHSYGLGFFGPDFEFPDSVLEDFNSDLAVYLEAISVVREYEDGYVLPDAVSYTGKPIYSRDRRLIEAVAFERILNGVLDPRIFGIYSAFCTWKDFVETGKSPRDAVPGLVRGQLEYDASADIYGPFMDIAQAVQQQLLEKPIWGPGVSVDSEVATNLMFNGMTKLSNIQQAQFVLLNGMHNSGLFLPLAPILGIIDWDKYIEFMGSDYSSESDEFQDLCSNVAIIRMLGYLSE